MAEQTDSVTQPERHRRRAVPSRSETSSGGRPRVAGQRTRVAPPRDVAPAGDSGVDRAHRPPRARRTWRRDRARPDRRRITVAVAAVLFVAFAVAAGVLGMRLYQDRVREANSSDVLKIVPRYASQVLSFDYRHLEANTAAARPLLSGSYRKDYQQSMTEHASAWKKYHYVVKSSIASAGVSKASGSQVVVVAFVDQSVSAGTTKIGKAQDLIRLRMTIRRQDGKWLLSRLDSL